MKDGRIVQIGTPEDIVTNPADDYVRDFVKDISKLKLVFAHTIMEPIAQYQTKPGEDLSQALRTSADTDLDGLVDLAITTEHPIVIVDRESRDIGVVSKDRLLLGIQGGK